MNPDSNDFNESRPQRARVAMVVANDVTVDTRVRKYAEAVSDLGYDVTVFGITAGPRSEELLGRAKIIRLNCKSTLKSARRTVTFPSIRYRDRRAYVRARSKVKLREREINSHIGRLAAEADSSLTGKLRRKGLRGLRKANSAHRHVVDRRWDRSRHVAHAPSLRIRRTWRTLLPDSGDWELAVGPALDKFDADIIHIHDVHLLGVAVRARDRALQRGRHPVLIYDAHEYIPGLDGIPKDFIDGYTDLEAKYIDEVDQIITVSPLLKEWLERDHSPSRSVRITLNAPARAWEASDEYRLGPLSVREAAGLNDGAPLVVYSGGYNSGRGIVTLVEAMEFIEAQLVLVTQGVNAYLAPLLEHAEDRGYRDRIHLVPFVEPYQVPRYLASADVGVHPMIHALNHEVALPNKFFEYLHGHVPVVVSDVQSMADFVRVNGVGEVFTALDPHDLARKIDQVLAARDQYASAITEELLLENSWERQTEVLSEVYNQFFAAVPHTHDETVQIRTRSIEGGSFGLLIGPANFAGQAGAWATAVSELAPTAKVDSWAIQRKGALNFSSSHTIQAESWRSLAWQIGQLQRVAREYDHALLEAGLGALGTLNGGNFDDDLPFLRANDITVGVVLHGSEIRQPDEHRQLERWSPFNAVADDYQRALEDRTLDMRRRLDGFEGQVFVTTVDLLDYVPNASWLPTVVDPGAWASEVPVMERTRPVVVHAPTNRRLKGTDEVEPVLQQFHDDHLIEYWPISGLSPDEVREVVRGCDIVVDQFAIGDYGVTSVQAMAAGRLVIAHVDDRCRDRIPLDLPIIEATPDNFGDVLRDVISNRDAAGEIGAAGTAFAQLVHGGAPSARQILSWVHDRPIDQVPRFID